jgi:hypothetical protein
LWPGQALVLSNLAKPVRRARRKVGRHLSPNHERICIEEAQGVKLGGLSSKGRNDEAMARAAKLVGTTYPRVLRSST